jgi:hypothetical protein
MKPFIAQREKRLLMVRCPSAALCLPLHKTALGAQSVALVVPTVSHERRFPACGSPNGVSAAHRTSWTLEQGPALAPVPVQVVIPLQFIANMAIIFVDEFTPAAESWFT